YFTKKDSETQKILTRIFVLVKFIRVITLVLIKIVLSRLIPVLMLLIFIPIFLLQKIKMKYCCFLLIPMIILHTKMKKLNDYIILILVIIIWILSKSLK